MNLFICLLLVMTGCQRDKGFSLKKVSSKHLPSPEWDVASPSEVLEKVTKMPYTYLGSGNHTYAFVSEDGQYVIKFFKQKHMRTKELFLSQKKIQRRIKEREDSFTSYKIAYEKLKEETGLVYLHLNKTSDLHLALTLIDQHGKSFQLNLDDMEFLIQKKATLAFDHLRFLIKEEKYDEANTAISSLLKVVAKRNQKGIYDRDLQFFKNFGFLDGEAIEIDIGEFRIDKSPAPLEEELEMLQHQIQDFLQKLGTD